MRATYRFRPALVPTLIALALLPVLIGLAIWQLQRASHKRDIRQAVAEQTQQAPRELSRPWPEPSALYGSRLAVSGRYDTSREYLLANRVRDGRSGYLILTPFKLEGSDTAILVARDWVAATGERDEIPTVPGVSSRRQRIVGMATDGPSVGIRIGEAYAGDGSWPRQIIYVDFEAMDKALPYELRSIMLRADVSGDELAAQLTGRMTPQRHLGYAFQWFALALALVVIYIVANLRRETSHER